MATTDGAAVWGVAQSLDSGGIKVKSMPAKHHYITQRFVYRQRTHYLLGRHLCSKDLKRGPDVCVCVFSCGRMMFGKRLCILFSRHFPKLALMLGGMPSSILPDAKEIILLNVYQAIIRFIITWN